VADDEQVALSRYSSLVETARRAFASDPSYTIAMAEQASAIRARQGRPLLSEVPTQRTSPS
jgi:hypothetical protein